MRRVRAILERFGAARRGFAVCFRSASFRSAVRGLLKGLNGILPMDYLATPAAWWGLISCVALGAWALGRWQSGAGLAANMPLELPPQRDPQTAPTLPEAKSLTPESIPAQRRDDHLHALDSAISLGDLHDEISAFRRREQIFATHAPGALLLDQRPIVSQHDGVAKDWACAPVDRAEPACTCGGDCGGSLRTAAASQIKAVQPSLAWSSFTRV